MKKRLTPILTTIMVLILSLTVFAAEPHPGDVDANGKVTAADARSALRVSASLDTFSAEQSAVADMDNNGTITASDARAILRIAAGLQSADQSANIPDEVAMFVNGRYKAEMTVSSYDEAVDCTLIIDGDVIRYDADINGLTIGMLTDKNGTNYMTNPDKMTKIELTDTLLSALDIADSFNLDSFTMSKTDSEEPDITIENRNYGTYNHTVYIYNYTDATIEFICSGDKLLSVRYIMPNGEESMSMQIHSITDKFNSDELDSNIFTTVSISDYISDLI